MMLTKASMKEEGLGRGSKRESSKTNADSKDPFEEEEKNDKSRRSKSSSGSTMAIML